MSGSEAMACALSRGELKLKTSSSSLSSSSLRMNEMSELGESPNRCLRGIGETAVDTCTGIDGSPR
jgi:hypothetical protein